MLTERKIKAAAPGDRDYKLSDGASLQLFVRKSGSRTWRFKYRYDAKEKLLTLGAWPSVSLDDARQRRDEAKEYLRRGRDPGLYMATKSLRAVATELTFERAAKEWHAGQIARWSKVHASDVLRSLERDIFPSLGQLPIEDIDEPLLLAALKMVERRGAVETAHRIRQRVEQIFRYARAHGTARHNPAVDVAVALKPVPRAKMRPAFTELTDIRAMLQDIDAAGASAGTKAASRFLALTAQRPGMVRLAEWSEIEGVDWSSRAAAPGALWRVPAARMKIELGLKDDETFEHEVPLARQAVDLLRALRTRGAGKHVFNASWGTGEGLSMNAIGYLYNREGYKGRHVPHGWRSSFSTVMNGLVERAQPGADRLIIDRLIIDLMLAHRPTGMSESEFRYNRAAYMDRRRELAQAWADLILTDAAPPAEMMAGPVRRRR